MYVIDALFVTGTESVTGRKAIIVKLQISSIMDKYEEALAKARAGKSLREIFPELNESEDEKFRKYILEVCKECVDANDRGLELSMSTTKKLLSYLEKQKEQKPIEPSDDELQKHQDELYDFKVFAAKQANEHHISFVHDFEWNNFCAELLSYFNEKQKPFNVCEQCPYYKDCRYYNEQKSAECIPDSVKFEEGFRAGRELGFREGVESVVEWSEEDEEMFERFLGWLQGTMGEKTYSSWLKSLRKRFSLEQKQEWSEEDEKRVVELKTLIIQCKGFNKANLQKALKLIDALRPQPKAELTLLDENIIEAAVAFVEQNDHFNCWRGIDKHTVIKALRSLKPHWKPSEEQMEALDMARECGGLSVQCQELLYTLSNDLKELKGGVASMNKDIDE